jgi:hypothetical protein
MKENLINKIKPIIEEIYDKAESNGRKHSYQRILDMIEKEIIKDLDDVKIACMVGINMETDPPVVDEGLKEMVLKIGKIYKN